MRVLRSSFATTATSHLSVRNAYVLVIALVLVVLITILPHTALAQSGDTESITMSPTQRTYTVDAGKTITDKLTIVNDGTTAYDFIVYTRPYSIKDNQYTNPDFTTAEKNADLYGWVRFPKTKFHLKPNSTTTVEYIVNVPREAASGGHYGVIFAEVQPVQKELSGNSVVRKKRVGTIVYATVKGDVKRAGESLDGDIPFWQVEPPLRATVVAKNTGNTHFTDTIQLVVRDIFGNVKYKTVKDYKVLPDTTRTIDIEWQNASWFGLYNVETQQEFLDSTTTSQGLVLMMPRYIPVSLLAIILIGGVYVAVRRQKK